MRLETGPFQCAQWLLCLALTRVKEPQTAFLVPAVSHQVRDLTFQVAFVKGGAIIVRTWIVRGTGGSSEAVSINKKTANVIARLLAMSAKMLQLCFTMRPHFLSILERHAVLYMTKIASSRGTRAITHP